MSQKDKINRIKVKTELNNNLNEQELFYSKKNNTINGFISDNDINKIKIMQNNNKRENTYSNNYYNDKFTKLILSN